MPGTTASERSSSHSPTSVASAPSWARPRSPLPPHRLAKLANALGVSTPVPAVHLFGSTLTPPPQLPASSTSSSFPDYFRRSPTPSAASVQTFTSSPFSSKFLLHVIPPGHLPHDTDSPENPDLLSPPPGASGYHTQFRRGILVPVYPTLSSQLAAIAKEYALPSAVGLVLYLVLSKTDSGVSTSWNPSSDATDSEEPGPRISEDIWRHIWLRTVKAEKDEGHSSGPKPIGLGLGASGQASPSFLQEVSSSGLRPLLSPSRIEIPQPQLPMTPSPSTTHANSVFTHSDLQTPESMSSVSGGLEENGDDLPLPGLHSPALIPILAKVEFDIDRRKAAWYDAWIRSRKVNHAKRAESRLGNRKRSGSRTNDDGDENDTRKPPIDLRLVEQVRKDSSVPRFLRSQGPSTDGEEGYAQLADEDALEEELTTRLPQRSDGDLLADVFGTDAETWAEMHAESQNRRSAHGMDPNVVDLALDGAALSALPDDSEELAREDHDEEEVAELWERHSRPSLVVSIPTPPSSTSKRRSSPNTAGTVRRPPPLNLTNTLANGDHVTVQNSEGSTPGSAHLPYLEDGTPTGNEDKFISLSEDEQSELGIPDKTLSPEDEKRAGTFFEDLDLGLSLSVEDDDIEYDENDPHDRRRSQFIMKAQLDEIEKNLLQLSPRRLHYESLDFSPQQRPLYPANLTPSPQLGPPPAPPPKESTLQRSSPSSEVASWPAVPYSSIAAIHGHHPSGSVSGSSSRPLSPPRFAINGISTEPPRVFSQGLNVGMSSGETLARQHEDDMYPPLMPPSSLLRPRSDNSPIIPLSPDPFGRFPSEAETEAKRLSVERQSVYYQDGQQLFPNGPPTMRPLIPRKGSVGPNDAFDPEDRNNAQTPSSRFSMDSTLSEDMVKPTTTTTKTTPLVSMKTIKKLWRKTNSKLSISGSTTPVTESGRSSPNFPTIREQQSSRRVSKSPNPPFEESGSSDAGRPQRRRKGSVMSVSDPRNSVLAGHTSPLDMSRQTSPGLPPLPPSNATSPTSSPQPPSAVPEQKGVRKSILKSWKSASGSLSAHSNNSSGSTPRSSAELLSNDAPIKRRRPSVLDGTGRRVSTTSTAATLVDLPPSPALPEEFAQAQTRKRSSQPNINSRRTSSRQKLNPSLSSTSTTSSSPPRSQGRLTPGGSPPKSTSLSRISGEDSNDAVSQFEIISPQMTGRRLENTLSYPYHALDHSMMSVE